MTIPDIAIVVSPRGWAERLHRFIADHGGAQVRARILEAREAVDHPYAVLVVEDLTSFLTPRLVDDLHALGRRVLGVFDPAEPWGRQRLEELGVDEIVAADTPPEDLLVAIDGLAAGLQLDREMAVLVPDPAVDDRRGVRGQVTVVGGPPGGPGATEVAIAVAVEHTRRGTRSVLVDADEVAPSVAQRLGLALHPNLRSAIDAVEQRTGRLHRSVQQAAHAGPDVVTGLASGRDRHEIRAGELIAVIDELARRYRHVVVDVGPPLDVDRLLGRSSITTAVTQRADRIVGVGAPSPVGVARLLAWTADVRTTAPMTPVHVAVNRTPAGRFKRGELAHEIRRTVAVPTLVFVPEDRRVEEAAWDGTVVRSGPFTRAVGGLVDALDAAAPRQAAGAAT